VRDQLVAITRGGKEIVNVDFEPTGAATVAETKNTHDMSAPRSHANQCMTCHSPSGVPMIASPSEACPGDHGSGSAYADLNNDGLIDVSVVEPMPVGRFFLPPGTPAVPTSTQNKSAATTADYSLTANRSQTDKYEKQLEKIREMIEEKKRELKDLIRKGKVKFNPTEILNIKNEGDATQPTFKSPPEDHLQRMISERYQTELELFDAQSLLDAKIAANQANQDVSDQQGQQSDGALLARIQDEFRKDPEVAGLVAEIEKIKEHLDHNKRVVHQANDPSRQAAAKYFEKLNEKYEALWGEKFEEMYQRSRVAAGSIHSAASIEELKLKIALLKKKQERQTTILKEMEFKQKGSSEDTFDANFLNYQLNSLFHWEEQVRKNLEQLKYEAAHEKYRVNNSEAASAAKVPSSSKALEYMAAAPVGIRKNPDRARAMVWSLAFSPDGRSLAIGQQGIDRSASILRIYDLAQRRDTIWFQHPAGYRSVAFSPDGRSLAAGNFDGILTMFALDNEWKIQFSENQGSPINSLTFLPNSTTVAAGDWDGWVRFYKRDDINTRSPLKYPGKIHAIAYSFDRALMAVGGEATTIQVYDLAKRRLIATLNGHARSVESLDFSPDGKLLASAGGTTVRLWDTATWKDTGGQFEHNPEVLCVRFSPDGKLLAVADGESDLPHYKLLPTAIILWDVATREEIRWLRGHTNSIWALVFSPDGKTLASGSADQTVKFWDTATGQLKETIVPGESGSGKVSGVLEGSIIKP
jgi:WD40 repeat protein